MINPSTAVTLKVFQSFCFVKLMISPLLLHLPRLPRRSLTSLAKNSNFPPKHLLPPTRWAWSLTLTEWMWINIVIALSSPVLNTFTFIVSFVPTVGNKNLVMILRPIRCLHSWLMPSPRCILLKDMPSTTAKHQALVQKYNFNYRTLLGELLYAYVTCRPDIGYAIISLSKFASAPGDYHFSALHKVAKSQ